MSPHCDDAVFSLGAALAGHVRAGGTATVVTMLAGDPESDAPPGPWDAATGFHTAGEAARARRREDEDACQLLGVVPVHLAGEDEQYGAGAGHDELWNDVVGLAEDHDAVFLPGYPLKHPDHRQLADEAVTHLAGSGRVRLYGEEPYLLLSRRAVPSGAGHELVPVAWRRRPAASVDSTRKIRAVRRYRSQLPMFARTDGAPRPRSRTVPLLARLWLRSRRGEWIGDAVTAGR